MSSVPRSLARDRNFAVFWAGQTFSVLGDAVAVIAIPLLVLDATGSLARMGLVTALVGGGSLVAGVAAGPLVDRLDRRRLMIRCDLGRAFLYALVPSPGGCSVPSSGSSMPSPSSAPPSACSSASPTSPPSPTSSTATA